MAEAHASVCVQKGGPLCPAVGGEGAESLAVEVTAQGGAGAREGRKAGRHLVVRTGYSVQHQGVSRISSERRSNSQFLRACQPF